MMGLIAQAVAMTAQMASQAVPDNEFVQKTTTYSPTGFSDAGLYNRSIGDLGQVDTYNNIREDKPLKKGLQGLGATFSSLASLDMNSTFGKQKTKPYNIGPDTEATGGTMV